jgi:hypothetical protein
MEHALQEVVDALRGVILKASKEIREEVKWNSPSFCIREHFATLQLRKADVVQLVFHTGVKARPELLPLSIEDPQGLMQWLSKDRGVVMVRSVDEVKKNKKALTALVREWAKYAE